MTELNFFTSHNSFHSFPKIYVFLVLYVYVEKFPWLSHLWFLYSPVTTLQVNELDFGQYSICDRWRSKVFFEFLFLSGRSINDNWGSPLLLKTRRGTLMGRQGHMLPSLLYFSVGFSGQKRNHIGSIRSYRSYWKGDD